MNAYNWQNNSGWEMIVSGAYPPETEVKLSAFEQMLQGENLEGARVLDHGCGTGVCGEIAKERGASVVGIDISPVLLAVACKRIEVVLGDVTEDLPFPDGAFNSVYSIMTLHIFKDIEKPVQEIHRVLQDRGTLIIGIVHPFSEKWDMTSNGPYNDPSSYKNIEQRTWVINCLGGEVFTPTYYHRPLESWLSVLLRHFTLCEIAEPTLNMQNFPKRKFAHIEYLFLKLRKK